MTALWALRWVGGKAVHGRHGTGRWIASQLPYRNTYVEPFAGMLGVLLQRQRSKLELVNDLDGRLVNWWQVVRDQYPELERRVVFTPWSRAEFEWAIEHVEDPDPVTAALAFTINSTQSVLPGDLRSSAWRRHFSSRDAIPNRLLLADRLAQVAERVHLIQIECRDAIEVIDRTAPVTDSVMYCDPPYPSALEHGLYATQNLDVSALTDALKKCQGYVAVSGYRDEWDCLDWPVKMEFRVKSAASAGINEDRTEVLWMNQHPENRLFV